MPQHNEAKDYDKLVSDQWDALIKEVPMDDIPIEVINEILIHFKDGTVKSVDISKLMADPDTDYKKLESAIDKQIQKLSDKINHIDWIVDRPKVQNKVEQAKAELYKDKK
tara:strand:- start:2198 stop:2527 length:330 start_codon:yes stop_codon:yes gene_type:complete